MRMSSIPLMDYLVSAARSESRATLIVRVCDVQGTFTIDDELPHLDDEARAHLKRDGIAIIEFRNQFDLEQAFDDILKRERLSKHELTMHATYVPQSGRTREWKSPCWR